MFPRFLAWRWQWTLDGASAWLSKRHLADVDHSVSVTPDVDLLIRTGGEKRLSDFLLWECAYAELCFVDAFWPDFDELAFGQALDEFAKRERRFGQVSASGQIAARAKHG